MHQAWTQRYLHHTLRSDKDQPLAFLARVHGSLQGGRPTLGPGSLRTLVGLEKSTRVGEEAACEIL